MTSIFRLNSLGSYQRLLRGSLLQSIQNCIVDMHACSAPTLPLLCDVDVSSMPHHVSATPS